MFQFRRFPTYTYLFSVCYAGIACVGFPIRKSADQWIFAPPRSLSQLVTSFFGSWYQGIPLAPFVAWPFRIIWANIPALIVDSHFVSTLCAKSYWLGLTFRLLVAISDFAETIFIACNESLNPYCVNLNWLNFEMAFSSIFCSICLFHVVVIIRFSRCNFCSSLLLGSLSSPLPKQRSDFNAQMHKR